MLFHTLPLIMPKKFDIIIMYGKKRRTRSVYERTYHTVNKSVITDTTRAATTAVKTFKRSNPLLVRKKMEMKDVYFRKNEPDREVMRFELAFDTELYVLIIAGVILLAMLCCRISKCAHRRAIKKAEKRRLKCN